MIAIGRPTYTPVSDIPPSLLERLSRRQCQVAITIANGHGDKEAAAQLNLSPKSLPNYVRRIGRKLGCDFSRNVRIQITRVVVLAYAKWEDEMAA